MLFCFLLSHVSRILLIIHHAFAIVRITTHWNSAIIVSLVTALCRNILRRYPIRCLPVFEIFLLQDASLLLSKLLGKRKQAIILPKLFGSFSFLVV